MKFIPLNNTKLIKYLNNLIDGFFDRKDIQLNLSRLKPSTDQLQPSRYSCSDEYLYEAFKHKVNDYGFPRSSLGTGMGKNAYEHGFEAYITTLDKISKVGMFLGTPRNALTMIYPNNGFIGWHHNGNAPGYNILMTYSQDGDGYFKYFDKTKNQIVEMKDPVGWSVKVGYYPDERTETDRVYWHCAATKKARMSIAWVLNHRDMWINMIEDITNGSYDKDVIAQSHMNTQ